MITVDARRDGRRRHARPGSAAASTATRSTTTGSSPTSRRCSTTRRCSTRAYLHGWLVTGEPRYRARRRGDRRVRAARPRAIPTGGFFSAEDADSEGVEGKFYCWSLDEIARGVRRRRRRGHPLLRRHRARATSSIRTPASAATSCTSSTAPRTAPDAVARAAPPAARRRATARAARPRRQGAARLERAVPRARSPRPRPRSTATTGWTRRARTRTSCSRELRRDDGRLLRSWQDGRAALLAYAEDYAALLEALLTLAELDDVAWLAEARARRRRARCGCSTTPSDGGFFTTGTDAEALDRPAQGLPGQRDAVGELARRERAAPPRRAHRRRTRYEDPRPRVGARARPAAGEHPTAFAYLLGALERLVTPPIEVAIVGDPADPATRSAARRGRDAA